MNIPFSRWRGLVKMSHNHLAQTFGCPCLRPRWLLLIVIRLSLVIRHFRTFIPLFYRLTTAEITSKAMSSLTVVSAGALS